MRDNTNDWCFEGGCTYMTDAGDRFDDEPDFRELEAMYHEPCPANFD